MDTTLLASTGNVTNPKELKFASFQQYFAYFKNSSVSLKKNYW